MGMAAPDVAEFHAAAQQNKINSPKFLGIMGGALTINSQGLFERLNNSI